MKHHAAPSFWARYRALPSHARELADKCFALLKEDSAHPSLQLKRIGRFFSVRIGLHYRALGVEAQDGILWIWIGTHADYDKLLG